MQYNFIPGLLVSKSILNKKLNETGNKFNPLFFNNRYNQL